MSVCVLYNIARDLVVAAVDIMMTGKEADTENGNGNVAPGIEIAVEKDGGSQTHCISIVILTNACYVIVAVDIHLYTT